eukprot:11761088-Karenia_brevis.AAC.1
MIITTIIVIIIGSIVIVVVIVIIIIFTCFLYQGKRVICLETAIPADAAPEWDRWTYSTSHATD